MAQEVINICATAITYVILWFDQLVEAMDVGPLIFTAFCVVGVISMLFMPFRGSFGIGLGDDYYTSNPIHRPSRRSSGSLPSPENSGSMTTTTAFSRRD